MTTYTFTYDVYIFDTDCYGVVWHGAYTKWFEMGRVDLFKTLGVDMQVMSSQHDIIFPVTEQNIRYKRPGKLGYTIELITRLDPQPPRLVFWQTVRHVQTSTVLVEARTDVVMMNAAGKMYRQFPAVIQAILP